MSFGENAARAVPANASEANDAPTSSAKSASLNAAFGSALPAMPASSGNAQSSSSIITPFNAACALSIGSSRSCRITGCSLPSISPEAMRNRSA